ncbi:MAG: hypothetical protein DMD82_15745 [Candidatus Rokuibacteriota bacterium]|nr:MAG: hypothetical protein DMD82_15745 [Candidatus Rokubacteria bacterium]
MSEAGPDPELIHAVPLEPPKRPLFAGILPKLSWFRTIVGITAGLLSISGALYPFVRPVKPLPVSTGEMVTIVQDARSAKPVPDATIEVLTLKDALVTTLTPLDQGRARQALKEGTYKLRVSHSQFATAVREIQVIAGQTAEVRVQLAPPFPVTSPVSTGEVVTIVQDARSAKPVPDATIEVLTLKDALVTTLTPLNQGRARLALKEGSYKLRVSHSRFRTALREIQVIAGQSAEVRVQLAPPAPVTPPVSTGEVVTIVQDARSAKPVPDATIEVLTLKNALVTTLIARDRGRARQILKEGSYKLRVSHSRFKTAVREIRVIAGRTAEVRVRLVQKPSFPSSLVKDATHAINEGVDALKHTFR